MVNLETPEVTAFIDWGSSGEFEASWRDKWNHNSSSLSLEA